MNEFLRNFVMKTILKMIENNISEWQVREYALGWYSKGVLIEEDLQEIEDKYKEEESIPEIVEDTNEEAE